MKIKHKVINDFQYLSPDKKIFVLKSGTILEEYIHKVKSELIPIDKAIIDNNPEFFEVIDWKAELLTFMKVNKIAQPAQLGKKLIPFIEDMVLSSIQQNTTSTGPVMDESLMKELERKESDLNSRERRIKDKEDELDIRLKRVEKRETEYKDDLKSLDKKEDELRTKSKELIEKSIELDEKSQELNNKERNIDLNALKSSDEIDSKYSELQRKLDKDMKVLSEKEKDLDVQTKSLRKKELDLESKMSEVSDSSRDNTLLIEEIKGLESDIRGIIKIASPLSDFASHPFITQVYSKLTSELDKISKRINNNLI